MLCFCVFCFLKSQKRSILGYEFKRNILYNRPQEGNSKGSKDILEKDLYKLLEKLHCQLKKGPKMDPKKSRKRTPKRAQIVQMSME